MKKHSSLAAQCFLLLCFSLFTCISAQADTLADLIQKALDRNLSLQISDLEIEQSFIDEKRSHNALIPDVNFIVNKTNRDFRDDFQKNNPSSIDKMLTYSLKLTQSYPGLGRIPVIQEEITRLKTSIKKTYKENQKINVLRNLTRIYFKMVRDQELVKIHETDLVLIAALMKVAKLNEELGLVLHNDILRIEVEQLNSNTELVKAKSSYGNLKYDLAAILDIQDPASHTLELAKGLKFATASPTTEELLPELFKIDNDINLARTDLKILDKTVRSARSANLPTLSIDASYNHGAEVGPIKGTKDITTTFVLSTPVYNSNDIENAVRLAQKSQDIVKLRIRDLSNTKKSLIEKAVADYHEALSRISFAEKMAEQSYENMRIVFTRYQEGASSIVELIDAQRLLTNSAQTLIKAYYDERERLAEILLLMHRFAELNNLDQNASPLNTDFLMQVLNLGEAK
jgi:outer membrane protein TolC